MNVFMLWGRETPGGELWLIDAWDSDAIDMNGKGWEAAKQKAYDRHGADNVRITFTEIDFSAVRRAFEPYPVPAMKGDR